MADNQRVLTNTRSLMINQIPHLASAIAMAKAISQRVWKRTRTRRKIRVKT